MRHKSNNKTRPLFTLSLEMTRLVNETRLLLVLGVNLDIYGKFLTGTDAGITVYIIMTQFKCLKSFKMVQNVKDQN